MPRELQNASSCCLAELTLESVSSGFRVLWETWMILPQFSFPWVKQSPIPHFFLLFFPISVFFSLTSIELGEMGKRDGGGRPSYLSFTQLEEMEKRDGGGHPPYLSFTQCIVIRSGLQTLSLSEARPHLSRHTINQPASTLQKVYGPTSCLPP